MSTITVSPLKHSKVIRNNLFLYFFSALISNLGTYMYNIAIGLYVLSITGSGQSFAITLIFGMLPRIILSPVAGVVADKVNRKKMILIMDLLSGFLLIGVFFFIQKDALSLVMIYLSSALLTVFNTFFGVTMSASIPNFVSSDKLTKVNAMRATIDSLASIAGPFFAGIIYTAIGIKYFVLVNGLSFLFSFIVELFINFNVNKTAITTKKKKIIQELKEGIGYLKTHKTLIVLMKYILFINFIASLLYVYLPFISVKVLHASPKQYGLIQIGAPIGFLFMSLLTAFQKKNHHKIFRITAKNFLYFGLTMLLLCLPSNPLLNHLSKEVHMIILTGIAFLVGIVVIKINIPLQTHLQLVIDDQFRGRVNGVISMNGQIVMPIGIVLYGFLLDHMPVYQIPVISGILLIIISMTMFFNKNYINM